eukprot:gnl/MRDRNA2_/MRDRNA2_109559_c0_seq1.p1 gnl/MRDRNA2_/MRDRNA2_109559_c0~~gnl/MRDRNA2_/MRDRNA2_109559_c0_seq1.p1  ORF type:complete len:638 (+),score=113.19 gnl/MRDRNA2_/MRDRNA2_109559_c0_seq1:226-2139(+)
MAVYPLSPENTKATGSDAGVHGTPRCTGLKHSGTPRSLHGLSRSASEPSVKASASASNPKSGTPRPVIVSVEGQEVTVPAGEWTAEGSLTLTASDLQCTVMVNTGLPGRRSAQVALRVALNAEAGFKFGPSPESLSSWSSVCISGKAQCCIGPEPPPRPGTPPPGSPGAGICKHSWQDAEEGSNLSAAEAVELGSGACTVGFTRRMEVEVTATRTIQDADQSVTLHVSVEGRLELRPCFRPTGRAGARALYEAARLHFKSGADEDALRKCQASLAIHEEIDPEHRETGDALNLLGALRCRKSDFEKAVECLSRSLAIREKALGPEDAATGATLASLGGAHQHLRSFEEAARCHERALQIFAVVMGPESNAVASSLCALGDARREMNDAQGALPLFERALKIRERAFGADHLITATTLSNLGAIHQKLAHHREAAWCYQRAMAIESKKLGADHPSMACMLNNLGTVHQAMGENKTALDCHQRALKVCETALGPCHADTATTLHNLGNARAGLGHGQEAVRCYWRALQIWSKVLGPGHVEVAMTLHSLGNVYRGMSESSSAEKCLEGALKIRDALLGPEHPETARTLHCLGLTLCGQGHHKEALELLLKGAEALESSLGEAHPWAKQARADAAALQSVC